MCLTIPAQVIKMEGKQAIVKDSGGKKKRINVFLLSGLKKGDWLLYTTDLAIKKISKKDAKDIIELLEAPQAVIPPSRLSKKFKDIIKASKMRDLTKDEIICLLGSDGDEKETLLSEANLVRKAFLKDFICIHGIMEFSNYCKNDCFYCGLRNENRAIPRYRMSVDEIVEAAKEAVNERGYKLLVLQSGEDYFYTEDMLCEIIRQIKKQCRVFIFMSIGERGYDCYKKMKEAGASGVLFRFETSNPELFQKIHPRGKKLESRFEHLQFMKDMGYFIASGSLIGIQGQTLDDLAQDILTMQKYANMISMGPFVPCGGTPLAGAESGNPEMNYKMIAVLRLLMKTARIPVVTALETIGGEEARKRGLQSGANSLMFNLTPAKYRPLYKIYPDRFYKADEVWEKYGLFKREESYKMLEERMQVEINK